MDRFETGSLITLFLAYVIIILLIVFYEVTKCKRSEMKELLSIKGDSIF